MKKKNCQKTLNEFGLQKKNHILMCVMQNEMIIELFYQVLGGINLQKEKIRYRQRLKIRITGIK